MSRVGSIASHFLILFHPFPLLIFSLCLVLAYLHRPGSGRGLRAGPLPGVMRPQRGAVAGAHPLALPRLDLERWMHRRLP